MEGSIKSLILDDLYRYTATKKPSFSMLICSYLKIPGFRYMFWLRLTRYFSSSTYLKPLFIYCRLRLGHFSYKFGIDIPYSTTIGKGFYIGHFSCIVVSPEAIIGNNVNISQGVTIGHTSRGGRKGAAIIGDNVYIGPGAKIVGRVFIGNNVAIGANAVVTSDLPSDSVAVGIPAKIISSNGADEYILNKV